MYCANCGGPIQPGQNFCNRCGQATAPASPRRPSRPPVPPSQTANATSPGAAPVALAQDSGCPQPSRVAKNLQILGIIWIVVSFLHLIPAAGMLFFGTVGFSFLARPKLEFLMPFVGALGVLIAIGAVVGLLVGWGLIDRRPWARMLAIVFGCLKLLNIPFGTALGIYTLWVLAPQGSEAEYRRLARVS